MKRFIWNTKEIRRFLRKRTVKCFAAGLLAGAAVGVAAVSLYAYGVLAGNDAASAAVSAELSEENEKLREQIDKYHAARHNTETLAGGDAWSLALVNETHPLDTSYVPEELAEIADGYYVDARILADLEQMMNDGAEQGLSMYVTSAYRSYEQQTETFNLSMQNRLGQGMDPLAAYEETRTSVAIPGTSEHATGLAVDIISTEYAELDERQGDTKEQQWLMEHCWEYGFILRYPPEKSDVTGIIFEPWHYRYVGKEAAREITEQGITLEEYLSS